MRIRWTPFEACCAEIRELAGSQLAFWVEDLKGQVVAGETSESLKRVASRDIVAAGAPVATVFIQGRDGERWLSMFAAIVERELLHQSTVGDMADATARLWKHTNALMRMAESSKLSLEPAGILDRVLGILARATSVRSGVGVIRLPGEEGYSVIGGDHDEEVDAEQLEVLAALGDDVRVVTDDDPIDGLMVVCSKLLGEYAPMAVARLATDSDMLGYILVAVDDGDGLTSEELKVVASAAGILSVAIENRHILSNEREATRLQVENELLAQQTRDMEEMVHVVAHDLRSPMTALYGFVHVALDELKDMRGLLENEGLAIGAQAEGIAEPLRDAIRSVEKLNRMVQRLLDFSKSARGAYSFETLQLGKLVHGVVRSLRYQLDKKEIEVDIGLMPSITGDQVQLEAVFGNLVDNSIKYMRTGEGPRRIEIGCQSAAEPIYFVADTGVGMNKEQVGKAFLPFQRFHTDAAPGDGIGLPHVRKIVERHGGRIWCESEAGEGTTFYFTLGTVAKAGRLAETAERRRRAEQAQV